MARLVIVSVVLLAFTCSCGGGDSSVVTGAARMDDYLPLLKGRRVAVTANQTTLVGSAHLVDTLISRGVNVVTIFAPEHGFREMAAAGEIIRGGVDEKSGIKVVSLYGNRYFKPQPADLEDVDIVIFDIQDVGARFYTYISTMHYVMEACAENGKSCLILDRPNPNGFYVDGPILEPAFRSFVGMHPVPVVHGMTIGEYAMMINGEGWLEGAVTCDLQVMECLNYTHATGYELPVRPSPNLPNQTSVYLYPSLCFFEGTNISVGRGTPYPFQVLGAPGLEGKYEFTFTPVSLPEAGNPPHKDMACYGIDLRDALGRGIVPVPFLNLGWLIDIRNAYPDRENFFRTYFNTLAGTATLRQQIEEGMTAEEIRRTWEPGLEAFGKIRRKYLLYD
ncbi:MAG: DUF1343 domain-containing protein [Bacteroidales bacterium]|jgi:uncharacterized protein YbbC (DUF1343 family)|nr:DUF1343 domain-containing protein [Bacteroidales bacterium]